MELKTIQSRIYEIKGLKVMLDFDLAELYGVPTKVLNQAVKRNLTRFPEDFMFHLTAKQWENLKPFTISTNWSQNVTSSQKHRPNEFTPYAFTEQGVSMFSSVLRSQKAINVNIAIMRAFVFLRQYALSHKDLTEKLKELESRYDKQFKDVYDAINFLLQKDKAESVQKARKPIGFNVTKHK